MMMRQMKKMRSLQAVFAGILFVSGCLAFTTQCFSLHRRFGSPHLTQQRLAADNNNNEKGPEPVFTETTVRVDDGGSNLTKRFLYKVNALMGVFDPQNGVDDERQNGNIWNAMLQFPAEFTFHVVGKTKGQDGLRERFEDEVKQVVGSIVGDSFACGVVPRGKSFTRITINTTVASSAMINSVYDALGQLEMTTMSF